MSKMKVLFLCEHNSARSQMAEGLLRHLYGEEYEVFSAGLNPTQVNPLAVKVMAETGIDISKQTSKSIEEFRNRKIDLVISVCRGTAKPTCSLCSSPIVMGRPEIINTTIPGATAIFTMDLTILLRWMGVTRKRPWLFDAPETISNNG